MKKALSILMCFMLLLIPANYVLGATDDETVNGLKANSELVELIASGDDYLVGGGTTFDFDAPAGDISVQWESGGKNHTHQYLAAQALTILQNDKGKKTATLLTRYASTILAGADWPDSSENDVGLYLGHFYSPNTGTNWSGSTSPTALSRFLTHSQNAKKYYNSNKTTSMQELGRALHYLADINEPHHAALLTAFNSNHASFETYADSTRSNYTVTTSTFYSRSDAADAKTDFAGYCQDIIDFSAYHALEYRTQATSSSTGDMQIAAEATMEYSEQIMAAYLFDFLRAVGAIK